MGQLFYQSYSFIHSQAAPLPFIFHAVAAVERTTSPEKYSHGFLVVVVGIGTKIRLYSIRVNFLELFFMNSLENILYLARYNVIKRAAGIFKIVVPIIQKDEIEGFVSVCGRPFLNTDRIYTYYIHKTIDADEEKIEKLLPSLNPIDPRTIKEMKHFITTYVP